MVLFRVHRLPRLDRMNGDIFISRRIHKALTIRVLRVIMEILRQSEAAGPENHRKTLLYLPRKISPLAPSPDHQVFLVGYRSPV